jgi:hypothetical protein
VPLGHRSVFPAAVFAMVALALGSQLTRSAPPDVAFLLYAAGRVLDGARLYRDIVEINPPLIIWLNVPVELAARSLHVSDVLLYRIFTTAVVGGLFGLCYRLVRCYVAPDDGRFGRYLLLLLCFALFPLAAEDFGQREHFVLALLAPYLLVAAARLRGARVGALDAMWVGVFAGVAMALKPHFAVAWLGLEIFVRLRGPRDRAAATPEMLGALGFLTVYAIAVAFLTPDYITLAAALGPAYTRYLRESPYSLLLLAPGAPLVIFALLSALVLRRYARRKQLWGLLAAAVAACYLSGLLQDKGFRYHFYPSMAFAFVLLGIIALDAPRAAGRMSERLYARVARVLAATMVLVVLGGAVFEAAGGGREQRRREAESADLAAFVRTHAGGKPVAVLSYNIASAFPLVTEAGVPLASRFPHLWLLAEAYRDSAAAPGPLRYHAPGEMGPPERFLWDAVRQDLVNAQPQLILALRPARDVPRNGLRRLHYVQYFARDSALGALFRQYEVIAQKGEYDIYQRVQPGEKRTGAVPSAEPGRLDVDLREIRLQVLDPSFLAGALVFAVVWVAVVILDRRHRQAGNGASLSPA